jgi:transcriptional regulator with XRE-family HTH domain
MTLSALAEQAGIAKSTVSLIERGQGNPSIDTLWSLAEALGVPFASLFHDEQPSNDLTIVRAGDAEAVAVDHAGLDTEGFIGRHMLTRTGGDLIEVYTHEVEAGAARHAEAHVSGLFEHLIITAGTLEISTASFCEAVSAGDLISFRADRAHTYRAVDGPVRFVSMHEYPKQGA